MRLHNFMNDRLISDLNGWRLWREEGVTADGSVGVKRPFGLRREASVRLGPVCLPEPAVRHRVQQQPEDREDPVPFRDVKHSCTKLPARLLFTNKCNQITDYNAHILIIPF